MIYKELERKNGHTIIVKNAIEGYKLNILAIDGKSEQTQYSGKNLCNFPDKDGTLHGVSLKCKNGVVTVDGTSESLVNSIGVGLGYTLPLGIKGDFVISGGEVDKIAFYAYVEKADGTKKYHSNKTFTLE